MTFTTAAVIPVRNRPELIARAIRSIQAQTVPVNEIIVVDDGSTDNTADCVAAMAREDSRIKLIRNQSSTGAARARNIGVAATTCDWIAFLDSDDEWLPTKHAAQSAAIVRHPEALASVTGLIMRWVDHEHTLLPPPTITQSDLRRLNYLGSTSSALVRRDPFIQLDGFDVTLPSCQDWDLWFRLSQIGDFAIVPDPLVIFYQTETVRITRNKDAVFAGHRLFFAKALAGVSSRAERRRIRASHQFRMAQIQLYDMGTPGKAVLPILKSVAQSPNMESARLFVEILRTNARNLRDGKRN